MGGWVEAQDFAWESRKILRLYSWIGVTTKSPWKGGRGEQGEQVYYLRANP